MKPKQGGLDQSLNKVLDKLEADLAQTHLINDSLDQRGSDKTDFT